VGAIGLGDFSNVVDFVIIFLINVDKDQLSLSASFFSIFISSGFKDTVICFLLIMKIIN